MLQWFATNARDLPWRRTHDPYAVWVSEIMLQQTQVKTVIPYWERWMRELPTVESLACASSEKIHKLWEGLGYYTRVRNMQKAAQHIIEKHSGEFPTDFDKVLALPGIGRYTAGALCSIAFNQPTPIVDGNVIRVLTRIFGILENVKEKATNAQLWQLAEAFVRAATKVTANAGRARCPQRATVTTNAAARSGRPEDSAPYLELGACSALNQSLMELGALICTPTQPRCEACPLKSRCVARKLGIIESVPNVGERVAATQRRFLACVIERDGRVLVRQRPSGVVNAHLWEFPNAEVPLKTHQRECRRSLEAELGCALQELTPLMTVKHTITRYRITLESFRGVLNGTMPRTGVGQWIASAELEKLPFTSAHRRVLTAARQDAGGTL